jgi:hypothetical protein
MEYTNIIFEYLVTGKKPQLYDVYDNLLEDCLMMKIKLGDKGIAIDQSLLDIINSMKPSVYVHPSLNLLYNMMNKNDIKKRNNDSIMLVGIIHKLKEIENESVNINERIHRVSSFYTERLQNKSGTSRDIKIVSDTSEAAKYEQVIDNYNNVNNDTINNPVSSPSIIQPMLQRQEQKDAIKRIDTLGLINKLPPSSADNQAKEKLVKMVTQGRIYDLQKYMKAKTKYYKLRNKLQQLKN